MEKVHYIESEDTLVVETIYDPTDTIEANKIQRAEGREFFGSKGQQMLHAMSIPEEHVLALKRKGYDLLSADPAQARRALLYIQQNEQVWMTVDGKPFADRHQKWL